ncbi:MAG: DegV family protein [Chloroflexi bacterium]|nr:DegV family protein [Chloroflexota bacterium]
MSKTAIVTDSTAYIPDDICRKLNITVAPLSVIWGEETFSDGVTIKPTEFYTRLKNSKVMPSTSQASPADMHKAFASLLERGYDVMGVFISEKLSGTLDSARQAREEFASAKDKIVLFDSENTGMALGYQALALARAAADGASLADCQKLAETVRPNTGVYFVVETLEFLHRGGRIGGAQRLLGSALNVKPILTIKDGKVDTADSVRTSKKAYEKVIELVAEKCAGKSNVRLATLHANAEENAKAVLAIAAEKLNAVESILSAVSPAIGTHTGPGTVGLAYCTGA